MKGLLLGLLVVASGAFATCPEGTIEREYLPLIVMDNAVYRPWVLHCPREGVCYQAPAPLPVPAPEIICLTPEELDRAMKP